MTILDRATEAAIEEELDRLTQLMPLDSDSRGEVRDSFIRLVDAGEGRAAWRHKGDRARRLLLEQLVRNHGLAVPPMLQEIP